MWGAVIGDIVGSRFEWDNIKTKDFELLNDECFYTDDTVMTIAILDALLKCNYDYSNLKEKVIDSMVYYGRKYNNVGYGPMFYNWIHSDKHEPYNSFGNGAAMRVSGCGFIAESLDEAKQLSRVVTEVSHNHPEAIKAAEAVASTIYMARNKSDMEEIKKNILENYYDINFKLDDIRSNYTFDVTCMGTIPVAFEAFFESTSFEDSLRNAIQIGGDSDTIACITGSIADAYYGISKDLINKAKKYIPENFIKILDYEGK